MTQHHNTVCLTKYSSRAYLRTGWDHYASHVEYALDHAATFRTLIKISQAVKRTGRVPKYLVKTGQWSSPRAQHTMMLKPGEVYATLHGLEPYGRFAVLENGNITRDGRVVHPESLELMIQTVLKGKGLTEVSR